LYSFWVDTTVRLESVGFFGAFKPTDKKYGVLLEVWRCDYAYLDFRNKRTERIYYYKSDGRSYGAEKAKEIFDVDIKDKDVFLYPGADNWYHIRFVLGVSCYFIFA
jgi:hypothetical protein